MPLLPFVIVFTLVFTRNHVEIETVSVLAPDKQSCEDMLVTKEVEFRKHRRISGDVGVMPACWSENDWQQHIAKQAEEHK